MTRSILPALTAALILTLALPVPLLAQNRSRDSVQGIEGVNPTATRILRDIARQDDDD